MAKAPTIIIPRHMQAAPPGSPRIIGDNEINELEMPDTKLAKLESWIARNIGAKLDSAYPNRDWRITVDAIGGIAVIQCPLLAVDKGYVIHLGRKTIHDLQLQALRVAGEFLERFGIVRVKNFDPKQFEDYDRDTRGNARTADSLAESITGSGKILKEGER